jgi:hypothetical protein
VMLSDVHSQPLIALGRSGLLDEIGDRYLFGNVDEALEAAVMHLPASLATSPGRGDL